MNCKCKNVEVVEAVESFAGVTEELFPVVQFPLDIFPEELRLLIVKMGEAYGVPTECIASSMITVAAAAIGNTVRVQVKHGWNEPVFIWMVIIGKTGAGKTPFVRKLLNPIFEKQEESIRDYEKEKVQCIRKGKERKLDKGKSVTEHEEIDEPKLVHYYMSDTTVEAIEEITSNSPRGFIIHCDELAGFVKSHNQYKKDGSDRQRYLELWSCNPWKRDRISRGSIFIKDTGCSILGGIQPLTLPLIFREESLVDGFLPRILMTTIGNHSASFSMTEITDSDIQPWNDLISKCFDIPLDKETTGENKHKILPLTKEAKDEFAEFYNRYKDLGKYLPEKAEGFIPKMISYTVRLSGILHIINHDGDIRDGDNIEVETIESAVRLTDYHTGQAMQVFEYYGEKEKGKKDVFNESKVEIVKTLNNLKDSVKNGKLPLSCIVKDLNNRLPGTCRLSSQDLSYILSDLGLFTKKIGGYSHLIWNEEELEKLFCFYKKPSTASTASTKKKKLIKEEKVATKKEKLCAEKDIL
tara:strand:- start:167 stop:1741 length:1575 start_codon:yes stop_codon:yes gene_type:complete